jgi:hypothetical protein
VVRAGLASGEDDASQSRRLQDQAAAELAGAPAGANELYMQAASVDQCWQGLARYWRKKAEAGAERKHQ